MTTPANATATSPSIGPSGPSDTYTTPAVADFVERLRHLADAPVSAVAERHVTRAAAAAVAARGLAPDLEIGWGVQREQNRRRMVLVAIGFSVLLLLVVFLVARAIDPVRWQPADVEVPPTTSVPVTTRATVTTIPSSTTTVAPVAESVPDPVVESDPSTSAPAEAPPVDPAPTGQAPADQAVPGPAPLPATPAPTTSAAPTPVATTAPAPRVTAVPAPPATTTSAPAKGKGGKGH